MVIQTLVGISCAACVIGIVAFASAMVAAMDPEARGEKFVAAGMFVGVASLATLIACLLKIALKLI